MQRCSPSRRWGLLLLLMHIVGPASGCLCPGGSTGTSGKNLYRGGEFQYKWFLFHASAPSSSWSPPAWATPLAGIFVRAEAEESLDDVVEYDVVYLGRGINQLYVEGEPVLDEDAILQIRRCEPPTVKSFVAFVSTPEQGVSTRRELPLEAVWEYFSVPSEAQGREDHDPQGFPTFELMERFWDEYGGS